MLAMNIIRAEGVMMFRPTCQNELEEMSRDGSRWLLKWCGAETDSLSRERAWRDRPPV